MLLSVVGCGYGELSPAAYKYAQALYGMSNRHANERVEEVAAKITASEAAGEITGREAGWLIAICDQCRQADWDGAQAAARRMMRDQVKG